MRLCWCRTNMASREGDFEKLLSRCLLCLREPRSKRDYVYVLLSAVPAGVAVTYKVLAELVESSPRAIGMFMKSNRCLVLIPCHRVVASRGLGGFSRGVRFKERLLKLEGWDGSRVTTVEEYWSLLTREGSRLELSCTDDGDLWG